MNRDRAIPRTISSFFSSPTSKKSKLTDHESDSSSRLTDSSSVSSTLPSLSCHDDDFSLVELNDRFSSKNLQILSSISSLCPNNDNFLNFDTMKFFADHLKFDLIALCNELNVVKPMFKKQSISNIIDFYRQLHVYREAFPVLISVMSSALTIPVSSTTCERTFSKMKKIKTAVRSTMSDDRLSDLCVLAVERTTDINFEQLVDDFSNIHKNSRIMLK